MLRSSRRLFTRLDQPATPTTTTNDGLPTDLGEAIRAAGRDSALSTLSLTPHVLDALDHISAHTVGKLLAQPAVLQQPRHRPAMRELRHLRERLEVLVPTPASPPVADELRASTASRAG